MKRDIANVHKWNTADTITSVRIAASILLFFLPLRSARFIAVYTFTGLNKLTGAALFLLPYVLAVSTGIVYSWTVCIIALAASAEELTIHFCQKEYRADIKSIFQRERKIR